MSTLLGTNTAPEGCAHASDVWTRLYHHLKPPAWRTRSVTSAAKEFDNDAGNLRRRPPAVVLMELVSAFLRGYIMVPPPGAGIRWSSDGVALRAACACGSPGWVCAVNGWCVAAVLKWPLPADKVYAPTEARSVSLRSTTPMPPAVKGITRVRGSWAACAPAPPAGR